MPLHPLRLLAPAVVLAAGCSVFTGPPPPGPEAGRYVAVALAGRPLPATLDSADWGFGVLVADTLELDGRGGARRAWVVRRVHRRLAVDTVFGGAYAPQYRLGAGGRLEVGSFGPCNDVGFCAPNDTGTLVGARAVLVSYRTAGGQPLALERASP